MGREFSHVDLEAHALEQSASVSSLPRLRRFEGIPLFVAAPFYDTSSNEVNKTPSSTVDKEVHRPEDDSSVRDVPAFHRDGWDPMGRDSSDHIDLSPFLHDGASSVEGFAKRASRL